MATVANTPLKSKYGFSSSGFSVDVNGNITARTLVQTGANIDPGQPADFTVAENGGSTAWTLAPSVGENPTITMSRGTSYIIDLSLTTTAFYIYDATPAQYSTGLTHSSGVSGTEAQGLSTGRMVFSIATTAPDTLTYRNLSGTISGLINIIDPIGRFDTIVANGSTVSTNTITGALTVAGGVGFASNLNLGTNLNLGGDVTATGNIISPRIYHDSILTVEGETSIAIKIADTSVGTVLSTGLSIPINNSNINSTVIGDVTPSTASFTSATISNAPTTLTSGTNKKYVDETATALSIAFGF